MHVVEVCLNEGYEEEEVKERLTKILVNTTVLLHNQYTGYLKDPYLSEAIVLARICESLPKFEDNSVCSILERTNVIIHCYKYVKEDSNAEKTLLVDHDAPYTKTSLPDARLEGSWEALAFGDRLQERLLIFAQTAIAFGQAQVNQHLVSFNRYAFLKSSHQTQSSLLTCFLMSSKL